MSLKSFLNCLLPLVLLALLALFSEQAYGAGPPFALPEHSELRKIRSAVIHTTQGDIVFELFPRESPWHVANFKYLADKGFYRNSEFHVHEPDYIVQGGGPSGNPRGGPGYSLPPEFSPREHDFGTLGMARYSDEINHERRSHGSQFHILLNPAPHMNGSYTILGRAVAGKDVIRSLRQGTRIVDIDVYVRE